MENETKRITHEELYALCGVWPEISLMCDLAKAIGTKCTDNNNCAECLKTSLTTIAESWEKDISECMAAALKDVPSEEE